MLTQPGMIAPSAGLLAPVAARFWIDPTKVGHVAFPLIAHPSLGALRQDPRRPLLRASAPLPQGGPAGGYRTIPSTIDQ
ncbi:hypothetical protein [Streptomyces sp. NPDC048142]|uniref:hypothetical protein n=1 Tax=Streptomyces sp. NPDC048142 TaxID=3365501 RepID=UPI00372122EE